MGQNKRIPREDYEKLAHEYIMTDLTLQQLSARYGVSRERIRQVIEMVDPDAPKAKRRRQAQEKADRIWQVVNDGAKSLGEIARRTGIAQGTISHTMENYPEMFRGLKGILARYKPRFRTEKLCFQCNTVKPLEEFHRLASSADGRGPRCKPCNIANTAKWYRTANFEVSVTHKICPACREDKPADQFSLARRSKSGLQTYCTPCYGLIDEGMTVKEIVEMHGHEYTRVRQDFG